MDLPVYQMEVYQKAPPKVKHTDITQKSQNWSQHLENIKSLQKTPTKTKINIKTLEQTPAVLKNRSSILPDGRVPKGPAQSQTYRRYSKISKLVPTPGKHQKSAEKPTKSKKNIKTLEQTPAVLKNRSSNLPDGRVPKDPAQSQTYLHYSKIPKCVPTTGKHQKSAKNPTKSKKLLKYSSKPLQY